MDNKEVIPFEKDKSGFPPWAEFESDIDFDNEVTICLNLDRSDHVKAHFYGLDCISRQPFICKISKKIDYQQYLNSYQKKIVITLFLWKISACDTPPKVKNGNWNCQSRESGNNCQMLCNSGFITKGLMNATCSNNGGWTSSNNWLEFPECLSIILSFSGFPLIFLSPKKTRRNYFSFLNFELKFHKLFLTI